MQEQMIISFQKGDILKFTLFEQKIGGIRDAKFVLLTF